MLKGQDKTDYPREYMRRRRAGLTQPQPKAAPPVANPKVGKTPVTPDELRTKLSPKNIAGKGADNTVDVHLAAIQHAIQALSLCVERHEIGIFDGIRKFVDAYQLDAIKRTKPPVRPKV